MYRLDLCLLILFRQMAYYEDKYYTLNQGSFGAKNFSKDLLNYWKQEGDDTELPRLNSATICEKILDC